MIAEKISRQARMHLDIEPWYSRLMNDGFVIIPNVFDTSFVDAFNEDLEPSFAKTPFCEGRFFGATTKRFARLLLRSPRAKQFIQHELVLAIVEKVLLPHCERIQLNLTQAIEIHPDAPEQVPHRDQDMWGGVKGGMEYLVNVMWPITDFTPENGSTVVWPGSNRGDPDAILTREDAICATMPRGSVLLFLGSTLHGGGANWSKLPRRGMIISYCLGWLKPWENQWLAYPPEIARSFEPELAALVGYQQHLPSLGNFEGRCPSILLGEETPENLAFVDALRPDQYEIMRQYYEQISVSRAA
jgi:ectoine hydroxylase-related dioxygenase (phytanoyl-CoA dioxygenase family)